MSTTPATHPGSALPWYRYFWPWFIVGLLATSVVAGLSTVVIAFSNQDSLVRDDWYKEGQAINRRLERDEVARRLGISGSLVVQGRTLELSLSGREQGDLRALRLVLSHPTRADRDREVALTREGDALVFRGALDAPLEGRWYATLRPDAGVSESWQLSETLHLPSAQPIALAPHPAAAQP